MKRVVVDTNVLVSATFWAGDSDCIIEKAENKEIQLVTSKEIIEEFVGVLDYPELRDKVVSQKLAIRRTVEKVVSLSAIIEPQERHKIIKDDPDDNKFLDCAVAAKAGFIVSQDKHLLSLKKFKGILIVSPNQFLKEYT